MVAFEIQRSNEGNRPIPAGREAYIRSLRPRLLALAIGAHVFSAVLIAAITYFSGGAAGYYFAAFYLVATGFRPGAAGYVYLSEKLRAIGKEVLFPRVDVWEMQRRLNSQERVTRQLTTLLDEYSKRSTRESQACSEGVRELRVTIQNLGREFETTVNRLSDNQEVIKGIQALARLVAHSAD